MTNTSVTPEERARLRDEAFARLFTTNPFVDVLGLSLLARDDDSVTVLMPYRHELSNSAGFHHGGAVAALADTAAAVAVWNSHDFSRAVRVSTTTMNVQYLGVAPGLDLHAIARCTKRGRDIAFIAVNITDGSDTAVLDAMLTYRISDAR